MTVSRKTIARLAELSAQAAAAREHWRVAERRRDDLVCELRAEGVSNAELARASRLSTGRVSQICSQARARAAEAAD